MPDHRILIVEDETKLAASIQKGLSENGLEAEIAYDGETGKRMFANERYHLVILDINLPHINGFDLCRHFRQMRPRLPIIMLTALGSLDDKLNAFAEGADDYLVKPFHFKELLARVSVLLKRAGDIPVTTGSLITVADMEINTDQKTVSRSGSAIELTAREFALLELLARNKGRVISKTKSWKRYGTCISRHSPTWWKYISISCAIR